MIQKIIKFYRAHKWILLILLLSATALFKNLGNIYLWEDEAETALFARNILKFGLPKVWDGKNLLIWAYEPQLAGRGFNERFIVAENPWAQYYLTALSFAILGESTFTARLPFAILGLLTIIFLYLLALKLTNDKTKPILSALILALSIQFILYSRQCHYFTLISFLELLVLYSYLELYKKKKMIIFVISAVLLFHSNYIPFCATFVALTSYTLLVIHDRNFLKKYAIALTTIFISVIPWFIYAQLYTLIGGIGHGTFTWKEYPISIGSLILASSSVFPLPGFIFLFLVLRLKGGLNKDKKVYALLLLLILSHWLLAGALFRPFEIKEWGIRQIVDIIPLACLIFGMMLREVIKYYRKLGYITSTLFIVTNLLGNTLSSIFDEGFAIYEIRKQQSYFLHCSSIAKIETPGRNWVRMDALKINNKYRKVLFAHPPTKIYYKPISLPENAYLSFAIGIDSRVWSPRKGDGVSFEIYLRSPTSGNDVCLFSKYIDPKNNRIDRKWSDEVLDLTEYGRKDVIFIFVTTTGPKGDYRCDWAGWAEPEIVKKGEASTWLRVRKRNIGDLLFKTEYLKFAYEITHDYDGPIEGIIKFLKTHAKPDDIIYANYESLPLQFYTNLRQAGKIMPDYPYFYKIKNLPSYISSLSEVDWFIVRSNRYFKDEAEEVLNHFTQQDRFEKMYKINYPDLPWENRANLNYHLYRTIPVSNDPIDYLSSNNMLDAIFKIFRYPELSWNGSSNFNYNFNEIWDNTNRITIFKIKKYQSSLSPTE